MFEIFVFCNHRLFKRSFNRYLLMGVRSIHTHTVDTFNIKYGYAILLDLLYIWGFLILRNGSMWSVEWKPKFIFVSFMPLDYESSLSWFSLFICLFKALPAYLKQVQNVNNHTEELNTFLIHKEYSSVWDYLLVKK